MKKIFLKIGLICVILITVSCKKNSIEIFEDLTPLTKEVISKTTLLELKQGQGMLSIGEREQLWKTKLNFILSNGKEVFTVDQRKIVIMLQEILMKYGIEGLLKRPSISNEFMLRNLPYFEKHFSKEQLNLLIESPYLRNDMLISKITITNMVTLGAKIAVAHCTCNYDLGCQGPGNDCNVKGCKANDDLEMCGLFGTEHCGQRCEGIQPDLD